VAGGLAGWTEPVKEGGGFAAAHLQEAAALQAGGRAAQAYGARPSSSSVTVTAGRRAPVKVPGERTREVTLDLEPVRAPRAGTKGQASRPASPRRGASGPRVPGARMTEVRNQGRTWRSAVRRSDTGSATGKCPPFHGIAARTAWSAGDCWCVAWSWRGRAGVVGWEQVREWRGRRAGLRRGCW
jgi:hypothetical protein